MRYNTGNAVEPNGSSDPEDLYDNSAIADLFVNSSALSVTDRRGQPRKSIKGMEAEFLTVLSKIGFESAYLVYVDGSPLQVDRPSQLVVRGGLYYRVADVTDTPLTLTGTWATDAPHLIDVGDGSLRSSLAALTGAGLSGFSWTNSYGNNTVGAALKVVKNIRQFGAVGAANDIATFQAACAAGPGLYDARGLNITLTGSLPIGSGQTWLLAGTKITTGNTAQDLFFVGTKDDVNLVGPCRIIGSGGGTFVGATGVHIEDSSRWRVSDFTIESMPGYGTNVTPGAGTVGRGNTGTFTNLRIIDCNIGTKDVAGTGAEYYSIVNPYITGCYEAGLATFAGNVNVTGGHIVGNRKDGVFMGGGANQAHGMFTGVNINHNIRYNLFASDVVNGETFTGCHFYANDAAGAGAIFLNRCKGININGGVLDCWIYNDKDANSGMNIIRDMYCPGDYGPVIVGTGPNPGADQLWITDCYGQGAVIQANGVSINDPSIVNVRAIRIPGAGQAISGSTQLIYNQEDYDRRAAYNVATGLFTVPAGQAGRYRVEGTAIFNGTGLTANSSYVEVAVGATLIDFSPCVPFSSTKLSAKFFAEVTLVAGDTIAIKASVVGTSPVFGDATYRSTLLINRVG